MAKKYSKAKKMKTKRKVKRILRLLTIFILIISIVGIFYIKKNGFNLKKLATINSKYSYSISTSNELATRIGEEVLATGGNAVDAAVAVSYALGVVEPYGSGVGGGGGMLIYSPSSDEYKFYDYKDSAPLSQRTKQSDIGVPGFVAGMEMVLQDYGTVDFEELIQPSIDLARNGFKVNENLDKVINTYSDVLINNEAYVKGGQLLKMGDTLIQEDLADTLEYIKTNGAKGFYEELIANEIVRNTTMTANDLMSYQVDVKKPATGKFNGYSVVSAPAPFSGVTLIQTLEMIEQLGNKGDLNDSNDYLDILNTATDLATYERVKKIADTDYINVNQDLMTSENYIKSLLKKEKVEYEDDAESESTTHFSIVDKDGMVVSSTNTLGYFYGSQTLVNGFYLNCTIGNFGNKGINAYSPGKKPRTFTSPTIVKNDDGFILGIGTPGGNRIVKILAPILVDKLYFEKDLQESINKNRVIFTSKDAISVEDLPESETIIDVSNSKYPVIKSGDTLFWGSVEAAGIENGEYFGASDIRRPGKVSVNNR